MSPTDTDKWTCPSCGRCVTVYATEPDTRAAMAAVQSRHYTAHRKAAQVLLGLGFPEETKRGRRRSA